MAWGCTPRPRGGQALPRRRRVGTPARFVGQWEGLVLAFFSSGCQIGTMNHIDKENPERYFEVLADFMKSVHRELEKAEAQAPGDRLQTLHLAEARFKLVSLITVIDRVLPNS